MRLPLLIGLAVAMLFTPLNASAEDAEPAALRFMDAAHQQRQLADKATDRNLTREYLISYYAYCLAACDELERTSRATDPSVMEMCPKANAQVDALDSETQFVIKLQENNLLSSALN
jgi:hypothetical protein